MFPLATPPALVIFDCDGVLVDSEPLSDPIFAQHLIDAGVDMSFEEACGRYRGWSMPDIFDDIKSNFGVTLPGNWLDQYRKKTYQVFERELTSFEGVKAAVTKIRDKGVPICVGSSGSREKMETTLGITGLLPFFAKHLFSGWDVPRSKPAPDLFLFAASSFRADPAQCVVIEDSPAGIEAGLSAGMKVLAFTPGGHPDITPAPGAHVLSHMRELPKLLAIE